MPNFRDEFTEKDKRTIAERAGYICSHSACRRPTVGPHSDPDKSLKTGVACHIRAAAEGGPRYDAGQSSAQRRSVANAIWLCSVCADRVDKDWAKYTPETLLEWKSRHEEWIRNGGIVPRIPELSLCTVKGLTIPQTPGTFELGISQEIREHTLCIKNVSDSELLTVTANVQLPEPILKSFGPYKPVGINVSWQPVRSRMIASGSPGASVTVLREPGPTNIYELQIDRFPPDQCIEIGFHTSLRPWTEHDFSLDSPLWVGMNDPPTVAFYIDGKYQFEYCGARLTKMIFAPIAYNNETRMQSLREVREDYGPWEPAVMSFFG